MCTSVEIRILKNSSEMKLVQQLEKEVWKIEPIPIHQTVTAAKNGGLMLGAFYEGKLVGFSYGFTGMHQGQCYLCSHMLGIHPDHQEKGIGALLKEKQKEIAADMGYELIKWTFDPLESRNAYLNLYKLNGITSTYLEDCYGEMEDGLNNGLPSDRFNVEWWINSEHVSNQNLFLHQPMNDALSTFKWDLIENGLPKLCEIETSFARLGRHNGPIYVPVPANFQEIKIKDRELAADWRMKTRETFQTLFNKGYAAVSLKKTNDDPVHYYILLKRQELNI